MDRQLRFRISSISGEATNRQRENWYRQRKAWLQQEPDACMRIELYSPPIQRKRLTPAVMGSILVALLYGLIALAIFEGVTR